MCCTFPQCASKEQNRKVIGKAVWFALQNFSRYTQQSNSRLEKFPICHNVLAVEGQRRLNKTPNGGIKNFDIARPVCICPE